MPLPVSSVISLEGCCGAEGRWVCVFGGVVQAFRAGAMPVSFTRPLHRLVVQQGVVSCGRRSVLVCSVEDKKSTGPSKGPTSAETEAARRERFSAMQEEAAHMFESRAQQLARQAAQRARAAKEEETHLLSSRGLAGITTAPPQNDKSEEQDHDTHDMHT